MLVFLSHQHSILSILDKGWHIWLLEWICDLVWVYYGRVGVWELWFSCIEERCWILIWVFWRGCELRGGKGHKNDLWTDHLLVWLVVGFGKGICGWSVWGIHFLWKYPRDVVALSALTRLWSSKLMFESEKWFYEVYALVSCGVAYCINPQSN